MCITGFSATHPGALLLEVRGTEGQDGHLIMARAFDLQVTSSHGIFMGFFSSDLIQEIPTCPCFFQQDSDTKF
jgi:hypothetical protein